MGPFMKVIWKSTMDTLIAEESNTLIYVQDCMMPVNLNCRLLVI